MNTIAHDNEAGNLTTDRQGYTYEYDYENRITKILKSGPSDIAKIQYQYDPNTNSITQQRFDRQN